MISNRCFETSWGSPEVATAFCRSNPKNQGGLPKGNHQFGQHGCPEESRPLLTGVFMDFLPGLSRVLAEVGTVAKMDCFFMMFLF